MERPASPEPLLTPAEPPTDPAPTGSVTLGGRRRYSRQRGLLRRQVDRRAERRWRREDERAWARGNARRSRSSNLLTAAAAVPAVVGVTLIVWASAAQVSPPTPPPVSEPSPDEVVPVGGAPVASPDEIRATGAMAAVPVSPPRTIRVPAIGVDSPVDDVGLTPDGEMQVPAPGPAYDHAAWYRSSVTPGRQGPSVIIGHIDSRANGPSVFFDLGRLRPGDRIDVARADGAVVGFAVTDVRTVSKDAFPTEAVYGPTREPELRLISCGGSFDASVRSYRDNIVVYARELPPPAPGQAAPPVAVRAGPPVPSTPPPGVPARIPAHPDR